MITDEMTTEEHRGRHVALHQYLDELVADWIASSDYERPSQHSILDLIQWSHLQTQKPGAKRHQIVEKSALIAEQDIRLVDWLHGIHRLNAGDFLKSIATAALRADWENYPLMRPMLLELKSKYPQYDQPIPEGAKQFPPKEKRDD